MESKPMMNRDQWGKVGGRGDYPSNFMETLRSLRDEVKEL